MSTETTLEQARTEYDAELAEIKTAERLSGRHLNCILTWTATVPDENSAGYVEESYEATIVAVKHYTGMGLFGPTTYIEVTACYECVRQNGGNRCVDEVLRLFVPGQEITVQRNTDQESSDE